jgi:nucleoside-diphosphate kinase
MEQTFALIKPNAFRDNLTGAILNHISTAGFRIVAIKSIWLSKREARQLYAIHEGRRFFNDLVEYMISGPIVVMILEKGNAIEDFRQLVGKTDPREASAGTIRRLFGNDQQKNAVHGSDSRENAERESALFFTQLDRH